MMGVFDLEGVERKTRSRSAKHKTNTDKQLKGVEVAELNFYFEPTQQGQLLKVESVDTALAHVYAPEFIKRLLRVDYEEVGFDD